MALSKSSPEEISTARSHKESVKLVGVLSQVQGIISDDVTPLSTWFIPWLPPADTKWVKMVAHKGWVHQLAMHGGSKPI